MKPLMNMQQAMACLLATDNKTRLTTKDLSGTEFIAVTEAALNRYGYQMPVWISQTAYQRCVTEPAARSGNDHGDSLWVFKVLALAKYAIQQSKPGATLTTFAVPLNDQKLTPNQEPLKALIFLGAGQQPLLLIKHASEDSVGGLDQLMDDLGSIESTTWEAV